MSYRWIGAILIITGCGGFGFAMAANHRDRERATRQLMLAAGFMERELTYRLTPLPDLCRMAARECRGLVGKILMALSLELEKQVRPDVSSCMQAVIGPMEELQKPTRYLLRRLGMTLGRFDLPGQLEGLQDLEKCCKKELSWLENGRVARLRNYRTLGLCAGAALAILFC